MARGRFGALLPYRMALSSTTLRQLLAHLPPFPLKLRGHDPLKVIPKALQTYISTSTLPPLPRKTAANG